jgi:valyl-tRNA synthetase
MDTSPALVPVHSLEGWEEALIVARWPSPAPVEAWESSVIADFSLVMEVVRAIRNVRAEKKVTPGKPISATLVSVNHSHILQQQAETIASLAHLDRRSLMIAPSIPAKPEGCIALVVGPVEIYLPLAGLVEVTEERRRLEMELNETERQIERLEKLLASEFAQKAPAAVIKKERDRLEGYREIAGKLRAQIRSIPH